MDLPGEGALPAHEGTHLIKVIPHKERTCSETNIQRKNINTAFNAVVNHHKFLVETKDYETAWIARKTDSQTRGHKTFSDSLDEKLFYSHGVLIGYHEKGWDWLLKILGLTSFSGSPFAVLPMALVAGEVIFNFIPVGSKLVFILPALMLPSCLYRGAKVAEVLREKASNSSLFQCKKTEIIVEVRPNLSKGDKNYLTEAIQTTLATAKNARGSSFEDDEDLIIQQKAEELPTTSGEKAEEVLSEERFADTVFKLKENSTTISMAEMIEEDVNENSRARFHLHKNLHWYKALSMVDAVWQTGKFALYYWEIERWTEDTRLWMAWTLGAYILYNIEKEYERTMTYFINNDTKMKNKSMSLVQRKEKKILLDRLGKMRVFVNGEDSDALVNALYPPLKAREEKIKLSMELYNAFIDYDACESDAVSTRNEIIHSSIFDYLKKKYPHLSEGEKNAALRMLDDFIRKHFSYNTGNGPDKSDVNISLNFVDQAIAYLEMDKALRNTLSQASPAWNNELKEAVVEFLDKTRVSKDKAPSASQPISSEDPLNVDKFAENRLVLEDLEKIIEGTFSRKCSDKRQQFLNALQLDKRQPHEESITESAISLLLPVPILLSLQPLASDVQRASQLVQDLETRAPKSATQSLLEGTGLIFLAPSSILKFICTLWLLNFVLKVMGGDEETYFPVIIGAAVVEVIVGIFKNSGPQRQEFADLQQVSPKKNDLRVLRGVAQVTFSLIPSLFEVLKVVGIVWKELEEKTYKWLIDVLIVLGVWPEVITNCHYSAGPVNRMITSLATRIPEWAPEWLKTMGKRAYINKNLRSAEESIEELDEKSTEILHDFLKLQNTEARGIN